MTAEGFLRRLRADCSGAAAIEFAMIGGVLIVASMNAADVGRYAYQASEVSAAAQAGAEGAAVACDLAHTPATINCSGLTSAVTTAIQSTRLGTSVTLNGAIAEAYYCLDTSGALQSAGAASSKPSDCSGVANAAVGATPTLYLQVKVTCPFQGLFPGLTAAKAFPASIDRTAWMRMA
jgi:Flp pilus assembly protein TadG